MTKQVAILDTSVIIDLNTITNSVLPTVGLISAVTLAELAVGQHAAKIFNDKLRRLIRVRVTQSEFEVLAFDAHAARSYERLFEVINKSGIKVRGGRALDVMIAATALANNLPLYTRNPKDFEGLVGLVEIVSV